MQCCKLELVVSIHGLVGEKQKFLSNHVVIINFKINFYYIVHTGLYNVGLFLCPFSYTLK